MKGLLTKEEYEQLRQIQKTPSLPPRQFRKVTVLIMLHQGHSIGVIEAALGLDDNTIRRYVKAFKERGVTAYLIDGFMPYSGKLSEEQQSDLAAHLEEYLYEDAVSICHYVEQTFGVSYSVSGITDLLHRLGFTYKQTKAVSSRADEQAQLDFLDDQLPSILEEVAEGEAVAYFSDGSHPTHNTKTGRGWIKKGKDFEIDCNSGRKRVNINAAVNALKPEHLVYDITETINAQSTQRLCRQLLRKHPGKTVYLICDNARYNRNRMLQNWAQHQRVKFVFLPPYSPNLNIIERLWRFLRKQIINSTYYDTYSKFKSAIVHFLNNIKDYKADLRTLLTLNFRTVGGTSIYAQTTL